MKSLGRTESLGNALGAAFTAYGLEHGIRERGIFLQWQDIVGPALARHAQPVSIRDGVLLVHCEEAVWRQEVSQMRGGLKERINTHLGAPLVTHIVVR
jgi:predicted nucleic acid-binding Zn ribbon protein